MKRLFATLALATVALAAAACSTTNADEAPRRPGRPRRPRTPRSIVAKDMRSPRPDVQVPAGKALPAHLHNKDGAPHNVAIYTDASAATNLFRGEIFGAARPGSTQVPALAAGTYFFRCDVHPDMQGTITAK